MTAASTEPSRHDGGGNSGIGGNGWYMDGTKVVWE